MKSLRPRAELAALLVAAACGGSRPAAVAAPPPAPVEEAPATLGEDEFAILGELLRMEDIRGMDLPRVEAWLRHSNRIVRSRAALAAGRIRDRAATPFLLEALGDSSASVRADAVFALGLSADSSEIVVEALIAKLFDEAEPDPRPGVEAAAALGRIGTHAALAALFERATPPGPAAPTRPDPVALEALLQLWRLPRSVELVARIAPWLESPDAEARWRAAYALARPGGMLAVAPLLDGVADEDAGVRALAARALRRPAADSAALRDSAETVLLGLLSDSHPHVRINAVTALASFTDPEHAAFAAVLLRDSVRNVAVAAAQALGEIGGSLASAELDAVARDAAIAVGLRATALGALGRTDPGRGARLAAEWASHDDWLMRMHAGRTLAAIGSAAASLDALHLLARDEHPRIAAAALRTLAATDSSATAHALFIERLATGDPAVRAAAVAGLARNPRAADLAHLMEAYERARVDTLAAPGIAIIDALAALEREGVAAARAFFLRFPEPGLPAVHRRVVDRLGEGSWGPAPPAPPAIEPRDANFYAGAVRELVLPAIADSVYPHVSIGTPHGEIVLELAADRAPLTVLNFLTLIRTGYYSEDARGGSAAHRWHRVVPNFVLQDGDPGGDGAGGPGYAIRDEINRLRYARGTLGMALSGPDTGGSQFFITHSPQPHLDGGYTVFGRVVAGMDVADRVIQDDPIFYIREIGRE